MRGQINQSEALTFPGLSQAVRAGDLLVLSGQVAYSDEGFLVGANDPAAQATQCFTHIDRLVQIAGGSLKDVVKLTCYLTNRSHYEAYADAKRKFFGAANPAGTVVVVAGLLRDELLMEVEAIAVLPPTD